MTTFTTIPNSSLEPGKPIRSIDGLALRDNPIAMFEGDAAAPRLVGKALKRFEEMPVLTVSASNAYSVDFGSNAQTLTTSTTNGNNPPTVVSQRYTIDKFTGSIRFKLSHYNPGVDTTVYLSIYKNNTLIQAYSTASMTPVQRTNDVSVVPGDVIEWRHSSTGGSTSATVSPSATATDGYTSRTAYISQLDNLNP